MVCGYILLEPLVDSSIDLVEFRCVPGQIEGFDHGSMFLKEYACGSGLVECGVVGDEDELPVAFTLQSKRPIL